jgi:hypothetical protein
MSEADIQFIDDIAQYEPKKRQSTNMLLAPISTQVQPPEEHEHGDGPGVEAFKGALPSNITMLSPITTPTYTNVQDTTSKYLGLNCIDVANHISVCPVCSKLHKSYSNVYIGIIVALIILCFFLGRRFFE